MTTGRVNQVARCLFFRKPFQVVVLFYFLTVWLTFMFCCRLCLSLLRVCARARSSVDSFDKATECRPGKLVMRGQTWWFFFAEKKKRTTWSPSKVLTYSDINVKSIQVLFNLRCSLVYKSTTQFSFDQRDPRAERSAFHTMNRLVAGSYALVSSGTFTV